MNARSLLLPRLVTLAAVVLSLQACTENAELTLTYTSEASPTRTLSIDNFSGSVRLRKGPAASKVTGTIHVLAAGFDKKQQATAAANDVRIIEQGTAQDLTLVVSVPQVRGGKTFDIDLDLLVPDGVAVNVVSDNGSVRIESLPVIKVDTTNGGIDLRFTSGPVALVTNDFPVLIESHQGDIDVRTSNAPIELISVSGNVNARTTLGAVTARITPPPGGEVFLATTNAPVDLTLPRDFGARLLAVTSGEGLVFIEGLPFSPQSSFPGQAEGIIGNGAGLVDVRTNGADVVVRGR